MTDAFAIVMTLAVAAALVIGGAGGFILLRKPDDRRRGWLMIGVALVTLVNVWLLTAPIG